MNHIVTLPASAVQIADEQSVIVRNGVDINRFYRKTPRPELKRQFTYMAVYLGVMGKQDGVDRIVQALHITSSIHSDAGMFCLSMIGTGTCWDGLRRLSEELKVADVSAVFRICDG